MKFGLQFNETSYHIVYIYIYTHMEQLSNVYTSASVFSSADPAAAQTAGCKAEDTAVSRQRNWTRKVLQMYRSVDGRNPAPFGMYKDL